MRKTLLVTLEYPPQVGGVANYYANMVQNLPSTKISVLVIKKHWLRSFLTITKTIKKEKIELVLVGQVLPLGTVVWLLSKVLPIKYITMTHAMDITYPLKYPRKKWLMTKILNASERVTTVSNYTKRELQKLLTGRNQYKISIIPPGPNLTPAKYPDLPSSPEQPTILSVGRLVKRKGHDMVLRAMPAVIKKFPKAQYLIAGDGPYRDTLEDFVKKHKLEKNVEFMGRVPEEEIARLYAGCNLFIMPSRALPDQDVEGFGLVFLEANSFGKPVIAGNSGGVPDAVVDGKTGFLVDPEDPHMIAKAIIQLLYNQDLADRLGEQGKNRVANEFTWKLQAEKLKKLLI